MLTCLVCGRFDLYTSADLLAASRSSPGSVTVVLDLADRTEPSHQSADANGPNRADDLSDSSLFVARRPQRSER